MRCKIVEAIRLMCQYIMKSIESQKILNITKDAVNYYWIITSTHNLTNIIIPPI